MATSVATATRPNRQFKTTNINTVESLKPVLITGLIGNHLKFVQMTSEFQRTTHLKTVYFAEKYKHH